MRLRRLREILRYILPEAIKGRLRPRLFGYRKPRAGADWSLTDRGASIELRACGVTALFPASVRDSIMYHCRDNGDSIEELFGLLDYARSGPGTLIDVGAADGLFAGLYCLAHPDNRAIAYEPSPELFGHLQSVIRLNGLESRIIAIKSAVGQTSRQVSADITSGGMLVVKANSTETPSISMVSLDEEYNGLDGPAAIKIDVEGYEAEVIYGARELLSLHRPTLFLEFHLDILEQQGEQLIDLLELLGGLGYRFQSSLGLSMSASMISNSPNAILRFIARPSAVAAVCRR